MFAVKVRCQFHPHSFHQSMEIVPHSQRELVVYEGDLTSYHFIFSFKACFTKLLNDFFASIFRYSSYVQCKSLNVWSVYFFFNTLSCRNYNFQRVWGVYKIVVEIPEGWGGYFSGQKLEIPGRRGAYVKFPPWWGYGYFLELHIIIFTLWGALDPLSPKGSPFDK